MKEKSWFKSLPFSFRVLLVGYSVLHILLFYEPPILLPPKSIRKFRFISNHSFFMREWFVRILNLLYGSSFDWISIIMNTKLFITEMHWTQNCSLWWFDLWFNESCNNGELLDLNSRKCDRLIIELICVKQYLPFCFSNVFPIIVTEAIKISFSVYSLMNQL